MLIRYTPILLFLTLLALCGCQTTSAPADSAVNSGVGTTTTGTLTFDAQEPVDPPKTGSAEDREGPTSDSATQDGKSSKTDRNKVAAAANRANLRQVAGPGRAAAGIPNGEDNKVALTPGGRDLLGGRGLANSLDSKTSLPDADDYYVELNDRVRVRLAQEESELATSLRAGLDSELQSMIKRDAPGEMPRKRVELPAELAIPEPPPSKENPFLKRINGRPVPRPKIDWERTSRMNICPNQFFSAPARRRSR